MEFPLGSRAEELKAGTQGAKDCSSQRVCSTADWTDFIPKEILPEEKSGLDSQTVTVKN